jgi:hypothetical protein
MTTPTSASIWETFEHTPSLRQRVYLRYLSATLVDLVVLGLFVEYWELFTPTAHGHPARRCGVAGAPEAHDRPGASRCRLFNARPGGFNRFMRFFTAWLILFGSVRDSRSARFRIRRPLEFRRTMAWVVVLIAVVVALLVVEAALVKRTAAWTEGMPSGNVDCIRARATWCDREHLRPRGDFWKIRALFKHRAKVDRPRYVSGPSLSSTGRGD